MICTFLNRTIKAGLLIYVLLFLSCDPFFLFDSDGNFWARDFRTGSSYKVNADLIIEGEHCTVWVERGSGVSRQQAQNIANEFDDNIYNQIQDAFSIKNFAYDDESFNDIMELAGWLTGGDGRLCILLLDIKDNYVKDVNNTYMAGYFLSGDFLNFSNSNKRAIIYIDVNPGLNNMQVLYETLAHEMQHLLNYVTGIMKNRTMMDTWIDEGLASAAEWIYAGNIQYHIDWFNDNSKEGQENGLIAQGNNFFVWGNRQGENQYAILDDYSTVYLFFQWLRLQSGGIGIYKDIISSSKSDYNSVLDAIAGYSNWETLLRTWLAANYINIPGSPYGYMGDPDLMEIKAPSPESINLNVPLYPGEGVYSLTDSAVTITGQGSNIKNVYLTSTLNESYLAGSTMLTFNANTNTKGSTEIGVTTGVPVFSSVNLISQGRSVLPGRFRGPYKICAGDLLKSGFPEAYE
ncbi:MAG: hypothetical protein FWD40_06780 [Treponema sp.]|nr:hypothetical protein [Treponema sp.]